MMVHFSQRTDLVSLPFQLYAQTQCSELRPDRQVTVHIPSDRPLSVAELQKAFDHFLAVYINLCEYEVKGDLTGDAGTTAHQGAPHQIRVVQ